jgi:uncharacterized protein
MDIQTLARKNLIFYCRSGSHAYGLSTPESDEDFRGVFVGEPRNVLGLFPVEQSTETGDITIYELQKFIRLAADCNPNIIELLFMPEESILETTPFWERIQEQRHLFLSKKAKFTFSGYAMAQLKKIRSRDKWIQNPQPRERPDAANFLKTKYIEGLGQREVFDQNAYDAAVKNWKDFWTWKENRNVKRAVKEEETGYDVKNAMHLVRLMRMCEEILTTGEVRVRRDDREELLAIRNGAWTYDELLQWADAQDAKMNQLYESSTLPRSSDLEKISELLVETYREFWKF